MDNGYHELGRRTHVYFVFVFYILYGLLCIGVCVFLKAFLNFPRKSHILNIFMNGNAFVKISVYTNNVMHELAAHILTLCKPFFGSSLNLCK